MRVITLAGSPCFPSRSTSLLILCQRALEARGVEVIPWNIQNFQPDDLINARFRCARAAGVARRSASRR